MEHRESFLKSYREEVLEQVSLPESLKAQYSLLSCLRDGERSVYLAQDQAGWKAVIKIQSAGREDSLRREYELLRSLRHPQLPRPLAYISSGGTEYLVREYIPGMSLYELVESHGPLKRKQALVAAKSLCQVLDYLHRQTPPVIHRDIKPQNIVIDESFCCHLIDLGIARHHRPGQSGDTVFIGTEATAPPEQFGYRQTDQRSDIYSVGMLLRFMLSGSLEPLPRLPGCARLRCIAQRCTAFDPRRRYSSAAALLRALKFRGSVLAAGAATLLLVLALILPGLRSLAGPESQPRGEPVSSQTGSGDGVDSPLLAQALRLELGIADGEEIPMGRLDEVEQLIVCGQELVFAIREHQQMAETAHDRYIGEPRYGDIDDADLELLARCTNLRVLVLDYQQISDISVLADLPLEYLSLTGNQVQDLSPLSVCTGLQVLDLGENPVRNIDALEALPRLRELNLEATGITSLEVLSGSALEKLNVRSTWVTDYSILAECPGLGSLITGDLPSGVWESIGGLTSLEELRVYSSSGLDFSVLEGMEQLRDLDVYGSSISNPESLALLPQLRELNLGETGLNSLDFVPSLPILMGIDLRENPISDFSILLDCPHLKNLNISAWQLEQATEQLEGGNLNISCG